MKKLFLALSIGTILAACGGGSETSPGGMVPDTTVSDTVTIMELNNRIDNSDGNSPGKTDPDSKP